MVKIDPDARRDRNDPNSTANDQTMSEALHTRADDQYRSRTPVLLYDANCGTCKTLAYEFRRSADSDVDIVALGSPEGQQILEAFYPNGWDHDFYLIKDGSCRKGIKALPGIARLAGMRSSGGLVKDYLALKSHGSQCNECDHDSNHADGSNNHVESKQSGLISRRAFTGALSAAAVSLPIATTGSANDQGIPKPPADLRVHVATVTADGSGGFEASVQRRQDLALSEHPLRNRSSDRADESGDQSETETAESTALSVDSLDSGAPVRVHRMENVHRPDDPTPEMKAAMRQQGDERHAQTTAYHGVVDHQRYGMSVNVGRGPAVTENGPGVRTTMSGTIEHDTASPVVDFVVSDVDEASATTHLDAYVAGIEALEEFYTERGNTEMAVLYGDIGDGMRGVREEFGAAVDDERLRPVKNHLAISGLPGFEGFAKPPSARDSDDVTGYDCGWNCGCPSGDTCCGCGIGCGICAFPCSFCYCCTVASCGCGYECCFS